MTSALFLLIRMIICFLDSPFVVMLILGLTKLVLLTISLISTTFFVDKLGNVSLMWIMSSTFDFEACV